MKKVERGKKKKRINDKDYIKEEKKETMEREKRKKDEGKRRSGNEMN